MKEEEKTEQPKEKLTTFSVRCLISTADQFKDIMLNFKQKDKKITNPTAFDLLIKNYHNQLFNPSEPNSLESENETLKHQLEQYHKQLAELKEQNNALNNKLQAAELNFTNNGKAATDLQLKMKHADIVIESMKEAIKELEGSKNIPENYIAIEAWIFEVLKLVCQRIEKNEGKNIEPAQLLEKYIIEYNVKGNRYFHGFYIKKSDIEAIKKQLGI